MRRLCTPCSAPGASPPALPSSPLPLLSPPRRAQAKYREKQRAAAKGTETAHAAALRELKALRLENGQLATAWEVLQQLLDHRDRSLDMLQQAQQLDQEQASANAGAQASPPARQGRVTHPSGQLGGPQGNELRPPPPHPPHPPPHARAHA